MKVWKSLEVGMGTKRLKVLISLLFRWLYDLLFRFSLFSACLGMFKWLIRWLFRWLYVVV